MQLRSEGPDARGRIAFGTGVTPGDSEFRLNSGLQETRFKRPTAWSGATERATKVACISSTESSTDDPKPSFRISTPNSFAEAAAPYSLAAATVMSKGRAWSEYQGRAGSLKPWTSESGMFVEFIDGGVDRHGDITGEGGVEDSRGIGGEVEILLELGTDVVFVA